MKLEDQVAPLALAQRMKELGFPQDTAFVWDEAGSVVRPDFSTLVLDEVRRRHPGSKEIEYGYRPPRATCAAPTVAEMLEWLPDEWSIFRYRRDDGFVNPWIVENGTEAAWVQGRSAAHALALAMVNGVGEGQRIERVTPPRTVPSNVKDVKSAGPSQPDARG